MSAHFPESTATNPDLDERDKSCVIVRVDRYHPAHCRERDDERQRHQRADKNQYRRIASRGVDGRPHSPRNEVLP